MRHVREDYSGESRPMTGYSQRDDRGFALLLDSIGRAPAPSQYTRPLRDMKGMTEGSFSSSCQTTTRTLHRSQNMNIVDEINFLPDHYNVIHLRSSEHLATRKGLPNR